jgi:hypothetical protein
MSSCRVVYIQQVFSLVISMFPCVRIIAFSMPSQIISHILVSKAAQISGSIDCLQRHASQHLKSLLLLSCEVHGWRKTVTHRRCITALGGTSVRCLASSSRDYGQELHSTGM